MRYRDYIVGLLLVGGLLSATAQEAITFERPLMGDFDAVTVESVNLDRLPVLPKMTGTALAIYAAGQAMGNDAHRFSKIGDCMTASEEFLTPFAGPDYNLGEYAELQTVIDYFDAPARNELDAPNSFGIVGLGTTSGMNTATLGDALFSDPSYCNPNEGSLTCEYRVSQSAFALIMLGTNDVMFFEAADFDFAMRNIVLDTIDAGIVPILYTFPTRPEFPEKVTLFNQIIATIAADYDLPLVNLWRAIDNLPDQGVDPADPIHLSKPADSNTGVLDESSLDYGYPMRNLITLQTLAVMIEAVESEG